MSTASWSARSRIGMRSRAGRRSQATNAAARWRREPLENAKHRRGPPVWKNRSNAALRGCSRSERAQQDRADERKDGEHRQHVEPQRKIHVTSSRFVRDESLTEG